MTASALQEFRAYAEPLPDEQLRHILHLLQTSVAERAEAIARLQAEQTERQDELAVALELAAARPGLQDPSFVSRWRALLDTTNQDENRFNNLDLAMRQIMFERQPLIRSAWVVREDNRQTVLALFVPESFDGRQVLYEHLLRLVPLLVNEANPDEVKQAATLEVHCRELSDKQRLTLVAHPAKARFEVLMSWRSDEELVFSGPTLRAALDFLGERYPY